MARITEGRCREDNSYKKAILIKNKWMGDHMETKNVLIFDNYGNARNHIIGKNLPTDDNKDEFYSIEMIQWADFKY